MLPVDGVRRTDSGSQIENSGSDTQRRKIGAVVVGGDHPGLAVVRSLGRRGIPVYVLEDQRCISSWSRFATRVVRTADILDERSTVSAVLEMGRKYDLNGWVLIPTRDETVAAFSRYRSELSDFFRVSTGEWESVQWAWDKNKTYELANALEIPCPRTFNPTTIHEIELLSANLPLAVKPAVKENFFYATGAKAWRADTMEQLRQTYQRAAQQIRPEEILLQEIIPGDGHEQYSYCAFVRHGEPHSWLTARRLRQHPREFGRAATYVETVEAPEVEELSKRFLRKINYNGLVEIEFKRDPRDGKYKLLDVNARAWGFHGIGPVCGIDFAHLLFMDQLGESADPVHGRAGIGWIRLLTDIPTSISDLVHGTLSVGTYLRSLRAARTESVFRWDDPLPSVAEILLIPFTFAKKYPISAIARPQKA